LGTAGPLARAMCHTVTWWQRLSFLVWAGLRGCVKTKVRQQSVGRWGQSRQFPVIFATPSATDLANGCWQQLVSQSQLAASGLLWRATAVSTRKSMHSGKTEPARPSNVPLLQASRAQLSGCQYTDVCSYPPSLNIVREDALSPGKPCLLVDWQGLKLPSAERRQRDSLNFFERSVKVWKDWIPLKKELATLGEELPPVKLLPAKCKKQC